MPDYIDSEGKPLGPDPVADVRKFIARSRAREELYWNTLADAAILASQQVQDKRLELLEIGPEVSVGMIFLDMLLNLSIAGIGGKLVLRGISRMVNSADKTRRAAASLPGLPIAKPKPTQFVPSSRQLSLLTMDTPSIQAVTNRKGVINVFGSVFSEFAKEVPGVTLVATKEGVFKEKGGKSPRPAKSQPGGDTVGVAVTGAALAWARQQCEASRIAHDWFDIQIATGVVTEWAPMEALRSLLAKNLADTPPSEIGHEFRLLVEAAIWSLMFTSRIYFRRRIPTDDALSSTWDVFGGGSDFPAKIMLDGKALRSGLGEYWTQRFEGILQQQKDLKGLEPLKQVVEFFKKVDKILSSYKQRKFFVMTRLLELRTTHK